LLKDEREKDWFKKLRWYRNSITHRSRNITDDFTVSWGDSPWHYSHYEVSLRYYNERIGDWETEDLKDCEIYFTHMADHIHLVWEKMKEQRFISPA